MLIARRAREADAASMLAARQVRQHAHIRKHRGSNVSDQPFVTTGGALPLPTPAQPETLTATSVATRTNNSFFIGAPFRVVILLLVTVRINTPIGGLL
jgi:hypothetical protein